jgi:prepilin-type N-terminal cleavage/methylation domain-containing protein/prepilin-type processing-associated H-X9-DG protein
MTYIHKIAVALSRNSATGRIRPKANLRGDTLFLLSFSGGRQYRGTKLKNLIVRNSPRAFTLIEVLIVAAIIAILAALAVPALTSALDRAKATKDMSNLRQIGILIQTYLNDKDGILPAINLDPGIGKDGPPPNPVIYPKYVGSRRVFQSPFDKRAADETDNAPVSYGINENMYTASPGIAGNMTKVVSPSATILMAPNYSGNPGLSASWKSLAAAAPFVPNLTPGGGGAMTIGPQHSGTQINALFCDLHAETMTFGPNASPATGSFKDTMSDPLGQKHWDPTK